MLQKLQILINFFLEKGSRRLAFDLLRIPFISPERVQRTNKKSSNPTDQLFDQNNKDCSEDSNERYRYRESKSGASAHSLLCD